jgi:hypothetical protein
VCTMMCNCADISVLYYHTYIREIYMYSYPTGESLDGLITHKYTISQHERPFVILYDSSA